jgi:anthranilate synthase/aminodeoxychorismate synthase-like glutamine amidotransferase
MSAPVLVIDNYDSFTFNLVQYLGELGADVVVRRNDAISIEEIRAIQPLAAVISPGPKTPLEAGISMEVIRQLGSLVPILGVCLGHQCLGQVYGGVVTAAPVLMHGKVSQVFHDDSVIFRGLPNPFPATRYHSLMVRRQGLPQCLKVTAWTEDGIIMGLQHLEHPTFGVQFHPESILTEGGRTLLTNFLDEARRCRVQAGAADSVPV